MWIQIDKDILSFELCFLEMDMRRGKCLANNLVRRSHLLFNIYLFWIIKHIATLTNPLILKYLFHASCSGEEFLPLLNGVIVAPPIPKPESRYRRKLRSKCEKAIIPVPRPVRGQRAFYCGHHGHHCFKSLIIVYPCGLMLAFGMCS